MVGRGCARRPAEAPEPSKPAKKAVRIVEKEPVARMAIVLDDWGNHLALCQTAIDIDRPLTLAILPHLPHSQKIARQAKKAGLGVMLHMPMEPQSKGQPMEPETIKTDSPDEEVLRYLRRALESVPGVEGVNNHQGSAVTRDERVMRLVIAEIKKRGLFFMDSQVIAGSVGFQTAKELGVRAAKRDVFLDNTATVQAVKAELRHAADIALKKGTVICIGHDKKVTLQAIREMVPELEDQGIELVLVKELLQ